MKHFYSFARRGLRASTFLSWLGALLLFAGLAPAGTALAANPVLTVQGLGSATNPTYDVTMFVDQVEILSGATGTTVVTGAVANPSFETNGLASGTFTYGTTGATWVFNSASGIARDGSGFGAPNPPAPARPWLLCRMSGSFSRRLPWARARTGCASGSRSATAAAPSSTSA